MPDDLSAILEPGMVVRCPGQPDWGLGQVQSNIGGRVTVNFENEGKLVIDATRVRLELVFLD
jgi:antitoxin component of MazEF toxin-antitoxin module